MKYLRSALLGIGLLLLAALLLAWFVPASWVLPRFETRLHGIRLEQVSGTLWNGSVSQVVGVDGRVAGRLQWQLSRSALIGRVRAQWQFNGPQLDVSGNMRRLSAEQTELSATDLRIDLQSLARPATATPLGQPRGELQLHVDRALLQGGWPLQLQAVAQWHDAAMQTPQGLVALGDLSANAQAQGGVIQATLQDDGHGPLQVQGQLQLIPLGWRMDATLRARQANSSLRQWLSQLGPIDNQGRVHLQRSGGLAGGSPPNTADPHRTGKP
ncbi:type II secretion system protein N [Rhodanobacter sp. Col0626]|uniref:type II secretion system protein N n=1 Tax=Rhodanobacter sp. Col0626 TaxID=3415679 RepID=UPI003CE9D266